MGSGKLVEFSCALSPRLCFFLFSSLVVSLSLLPLPSLSLLSLLQVLLLNGVNSGKGCRRYLGLGNNYSYVSTNGIVQGGIPACLWQVRGEGR